MDKKFRILIVDDEPNNLKLFQQILGETYELKFASCDCKRTILETSFDVTRTIRIQ